MTVPNGSIIIDSATGSDTAASGLGPATAVSGAGASLNSTSTVDLSADTPDLSGVSAGDLLWVDTSSGRQFSIIASVNDGADTVTCDDAFSVTESGKNWGIGGKRASLGTSSRLFTSDYKAGWTVELADGHSETISGTLDAATAISDGTGIFTLQGEFGATTKPILTFSNNGASLQISTNYILIKDIEFRNSNATKTASVAIYIGNYGICTFEGLTIADATNNYWRGITSFTYGGGWLITNTEIANTADSGIDINKGSVRLYDCYIHDCGGSGFNSADFNGGNPGCVVNCIFDSNGVHGFSINDIGGIGYNPVPFINSIFYNNTSNGIEVNSLRATYGLVFRDCIFESNGGYGIDFNGLGIEYLDSLVEVNRNAFYNNTSGKYLPTDLNSKNESVLTGSAFVDAANADFNLNNTSGGGATLRAVTYDLPG